MNPCGFWWRHNVYKMADESSRYFVAFSMANTLRPRKNGRHFADGIFNCIFMNENIWISIKITLKFVPKGPISNIPALVQIRAWRRPGDKPLSKPMMVRLPTHICVTRPQWIKSKLFDWLIRRTTSGHNVLLIGYLPLFTFIEFTDILNNIKYEITVDVLV